MPAGKEPAAATALFVPVRSNAHSLLAGAPVASVRRRLKAASVTFDQLHLESSQFRIQAGPQGAVTMPLIDEEGQAFQTARSRHVAAGQRFVLRIGDVLPSGIAPEAIPAAIANHEFRDAINSEASINWVATLRPFASEFTAACNWIHYGSYEKNPAADSTAREWSFADRRNAALEEALPVAFVRSTVIDHSNRDLSLAAHARVSVMQDGIHQRVMTNRFADESGWRASGFAVPMLVPDVGQLSWDDVAAVRNHRSMSDFRRILQEIELEVLTDALTGDLESAVHHALERHMARAVGQVEGLGSAIRTGVFELGFGTMTGVLTAGFTGPIGVASGAGIGAVAAGLTAARANCRSRRSRGWVSVYQELSP